jgi:hypothetical protein
LTNIRLNSDAVVTDMGTNGQAKAKADLDFTSVIAPGLFLEIGLGKSPFVLGGGVELAPAARRYFSCADATTPCSTTTLAPAARFTAFIAVDMPVFPLW